MKTIDQRADEYVAKTNLQPETYKGDVQTAYCTACTDQNKVLEPVITVLKNYIGLLEMPMNKNPMHEAIAIMDKWHKLIEDAEVQAGIFVPKCKP